MQGRWRGSSFSQESCSAGWLLEVDSCSPGPTLFTYKKKSKYIWEVSILLSFDSSEKHVSDAKIPLFTSELISVFGLSSSIIGRPLLKSQNASQNLLPLRVSTTSISAILSLCFLPTFF
jgi:hypothetical protein